MSFFRLRSKITVGRQSVNQLIFDYVCEVEVSSSWENLTDTAKITLPNKLKFQGQNLASGSQALFKKGNYVKIELGYAGTLIESVNTVFDGYISAIKPDSPLVLECEDAMWLLKQRSITKSWKSVSVKQLLTEIQPLVFDCDDITLGQFRVTRVTSAQILDELKDKYGLYSWVKKWQMGCRPTNLRQGRYFAWW